MGSLKRSCIFASFVSHHILFCVLISSSFQAKQRSNFVLEHNNASSLKIDFEYQILILLHDLCQLWIVIPDQKLSNSDFLVILFDLCLFRFFISGDQNKNFWLSSNNSWENCWKKFCHLWIIKEYLELSVKACLCPKF